LEVHGGRLVRALGL